jgi:hypothetical protein
MIKVYRLNEWANSGAITGGNFARNLPFYGAGGDFNFTVSRSQFTPGISISMAPLTDMSVKGDPGFSPFDLELSKLKFYFKPGDRVRGKVINSTLDSENGKIVVGKLHKIVPDYSTNSIRAWIKNPSTLESTEIYVDTIERIYESSSKKALDFSKFINS